MLDGILGREDVAIGDLILAEVLHGFHEDRDFEQARVLLGTLPCVALGGPVVALKAARNFRLLRRLGVTVHKTIDTLIATRCIEDGLELLHADRDFDPFEKHLKLRVRR